MGQVGEDAHYSLGGAWPAAVILDVCCRCDSTNDDGYAAPDQVKPRRRDDRIRAHHPTC